MSDFLDKLDKNITNKKNRKNKEKKFEYDFWKKYYEFEAKIFNIYLEKDIKKLEKILNKSIEEDDYFIEIIFNKASGLIISNKLHLSDFIVNKYIEIKIHNQALSYLSKIEHKKKYKLSEDNYCILVTKFEEYDPSYGSPSKPKKKEFESIQTAEHHFDAVISQKLRRGYI